jgi:hypothetical protein
MTGDIFYDCSPDDMEQRRKRVAKAMMLHCARPSLIRRHTDYTRDRLEGIRRRAGLPKVRRPRGISPYSVFRNFLSSPDISNEGATAAVLWSLTITPAESLPNNVARLLRGEQLVATLEALQAIVPETRMTLELLSLLILSLRKSQSLALSRCHECSAATLIEPLNPKFEVPKCETCDPGAGRHTL